MTRIKLKMWRVSKELRQCDIAEALEITTSHYSNIETGKADPSFELLERFKQKYKENDVIALFERKGGVNNELVSN